MQRKKRKRNETKRNETKPTLESKIHKQQNQLISNLSNQSAKSQRSQGEDASQTQKKGKLKKRKFKLRYQNPRKAKMQIENKERTKLKKHPHLQKCDSKNHKGKVQNKTNTRERNIPKADSKILQAKKQQ